MKFVFSAATIAVMVLYATSVLAHGGGLNRDGCHNDHKRGTYHCH